jgi:hypothetical protein
MSLTRVRILVALLVCFQCNGTTSFTVHSQCGRLVVKGHSESGGGISETESETGKGNTNNEVKGTKLEFKGEFQVASDPLPSLLDQQIASFFENPKYRNLLVTAGGKRKCEEITPTEKILEDWKKACDLVGAQYPSESDVVLSIVTGGIELPGLQLVSKAQIGVKLLREPSLRYEFTLIGDERTVTGLAPVVWVFNKLTGTSDGNEKNENTSTSSLSVVSYKRTDDGKTIFTTNSSISVSVRFPSALLKILPTNKEKAEETGGKAITKTIEKDVQASMKAFEEEYLKLLS